MKYTKKYEQNNFVLHNYTEDVHEKFYIVSIKYSHKDCFNVIARWGRRGNKAQNAIKATVKTFPLAVKYAQFYIANKMKGGYLDILDPQYIEGCKYNSVEWLTYEDVAEGYFEEPIDDRFIYEGKLSSNIALCVDNKKIENFFDEGIEYIAHDVRIDCFYKARLKVENKFGDIEDLGIERFKLK
jgi:predicted DNA-binding WGR domain protein